MTKKSAQVAKKKTMGRPATLPPFNPNIPPQFQAGGKWHKLLVEVETAIRLTKLERQHAGLGWLNLSRKLYRYMGEVMVESQPGKTSWEVSSSDFHAWRWVDKKGKWDWEAFADVK